MKNTVFSLGMEPQGHTTLHSHQDALARKAAQQAQHSGPVPIQKTRAFQAMVSL